MKIAINISGITNGDMDFSEFDKLGDVTYFGELEKPEIIDTARDCDALIVNKVIVDEELISACPKLKYVGVFATGYNVVDLNACRARNITVCNVPDYSTYSVAQHAIALLLYFYGSVDKYVKSVAAGDWVKSKTFTYFPWQTHEVHGKTFGIIGYGNIGKRTAEIANALGARVIVNTRTSRNDCPYEQVSREYLFANSDIISLHCALTEQTAELINEQTLSLMKDSAIIINTARGGLIDEHALANALNGGKIAGACLDTVAEEPMKADNPLLTAKNCIITPHVAWVARETRTRLLGIAAQNLRAFVEGNPQNVIS